VARWTVFVAKPRGCREALCARFPAPSDSPNPAGFSLTYYARLHFAPSGLKTWGLAGFVGGGAVSSFGEVLSWGAGRGRGVGWLGRGAI